MLRWLYHLFYKSASYLHIFRCHKGTNEFFEAYEAPHLALHAQRCIVVYIFSMNGPLINAGMTKKLPDKGIDTIKRAKFNPITEIPFIPKKRVV